MNDMETKASEFALKVLHLVGSEAATVRREDTKDPDEAAAAFVYGLACAFKVLCDDMRLDPSFVLEQIEDIKLSHDE